MVSVKEALAQITATTFNVGKTVCMATELATGYVLSEAVYAPIDMPPFRRSAMDGYALRLSDGNKYKVVGEIKAGDSRLPELQLGDAVRIFTGAQLPDTANAVVMQEKVVYEHRTIILEAPCVEGENIRSRGEELLKGDEALPQHIRLTPAAIGFLTSLGIKTVEVFSKPAISIIITGDELEPPGKPLAAGKIYESNSFMLQSVLERTGYSFTTTYRVEDDFLSTRTAIEHACSKSDVILLSGGISVGDYDLSGKVLKAMGVRTVFYKVNQKPGKPLYFGLTKDNKPVFALPGNPASALTCFYVYVYPLLQHWEGNKAPHLQMLSLPCCSNFEKKKNYTQFLKAHIEKGAATILEGQSSSMLHTYARANALVVMPEHVSKVRAGALVDVMLLPI